MNEAMKGIQAAGAVNTSEDKHLFINRAIRDINNVLEQVNNIKRRVNGTDAPPVEAAVEKLHNEITLLEVLDGGGGRINDVVLQIHESLNELEGSLF